MSSDLKPPCSIQDLVNIRTMLLLFLQITGDGVFGKQFDEKLKAKTERIKKLAEVQTTNGYYKL